MSIVYGITAVVALLLLASYVFLVRKKELWLLLVYVCVFVTNCGYTLLSVSKTVEFAIFANKMAYLGSVFLSMCMLMTIVKLCGFEFKKSLPITLLVLGIMMFAIIATTGYLPLYYKEISLVFVDGAAKLEKVYGVLHPVYLLYLVGYFIAMIVTIIHSIKAKKVGSHKHAALMAVIVFGNIAVWFVEKFIPWDFEFLSISYLFSEFVFLGIYWMMQDYVRVDLVPTPESFGSRPAPVDIATMPMEEKILKILSFLEEGEILSAREREILELVLLNKKRKEIADELCLSENTIKTYTRTLYGKLGVGSREELYALLIK